MTISNTEISSDEEGIVNPLKTKSQQKVSVTSLLLPGNDTIYREI